MVINFRAAFLILTYEYDIFLQLSDLAMGTDMQKHITTPGSKEAEFLSLVSSQDKQGFNIENAVRFWGSRALVKKKLEMINRMNRNGRDLYCEL